jgi:thioredoxin-like negative regulator of GroEL
MPFVKKYEPSNYSSALKDTKHITGIVLVFHPSCFHCQQLRPQWEMMKRQCPPRAKIIEVNGEGLSESPAMSQSEIAKNTDGFPSIMRLNKGKVVEKFNEERSVPNMLKFVKKSVEKMQTGKKSMKKSLKKRKTQRK